jgi:CxxC motif-containing protein (DUF1111 family)
MTHRAAALLLVVWAAACSPRVPEVVEAAPGDPLPGLAPDESARFLAGKALFNRAFTPEEGLGPLFNQPQCSSCHDLPTSGGHGAEPVQKATRFDAASGCSTLSEGGGDLLQRAVTPAGRALGLTPERIPQGATDASDIQPPPLYGLGLIEAVPLSAIAAQADPDDRDGDGISGRLGRSVDGTAGLFGMKATHATLASFIEEATRGELGLTTPAHPADLLPQGLPLPDGADPAPDPEVDDAFLEALSDYVRFLAPSAAEMPGAEGERAAVAQGRELFTEVGCADCHTPTWTTGPNDSPALSEKRFIAYSDFLLHDMGPDLADICAPGGTPSEWRTTRLLGLSARSIFLHNGRAQRLTDAIELHGGEAERSRDRYRSLPEEFKQDLIRFLQSL